MRSCANGKPLKLITFPVQVAHAKQICLPGFAVYCTADKKLTAEAIAQSCSVKKVFLEIPQNLQENNCARVWHRCFPVNFAKLLRTPFLTEHLRWLLLLMSG